MQAHAEHNLVAVERGISHIHLPKKGIDIHPYRIGSKIALRCLAVLSSRLTQMSKQGSETMLRLSSLWLQSS